MAEEAGGGVSFAELGSNFRLVGLISAMRYIDESENGLLWPGPMCDTAAQRETMSTLLIHNR